MTNQPCWEIWGILVVTQFLGYAWGRQDERRGESWLLRAGAILLTQSIMVRLILSL